MCILISCKNNFILICFYLFFFSINHRIYIVISKKEFNLFLTTNIKNNDYLLHLNTYNFI